MNKKQKLVIAKKGMNNCKCKEHLLDFIKAVVSLDDTNKINKNTDWFDLLDSQYFTKDEVLLVEQNNDTDYIIIATKKEIDAEFKKMIKKFK